MSSFIYADHATPPNLVPTTPSKDANYWCTWYAQNYWIQRGGEIKNVKGISNPAAREEINDHSLYNKKDGWASSYLPRGRADVTFLIDHGWQEKNTKHLKAGATPFFSLQIDDADFHRYKNDNPAESLRLFNEDIKKLGWRDLGLWVRGNVSKAAAERMVKWSKEAGINYWKIDGGGTRHYYSYQIKQKIFPELTLEYICGANGPLNPKWNDSTRTEFPSVYAPGGAKHDIAFNIMQNCEVFRTYDVAPLLVSTTTMRRISDILSQSQGQSKYIAKLNIQDDPQVAAGMGCLIASKRHPNYMERTLDGKDFHHQMSGARMIQQRMNEIERFGRWSRIAPAFSAGTGSFLRSDSELIDFIKHEKRNTWFSTVYGKMVYQSAPAIMARNMPIPIIEPMKNPPYVMASTYPNGPLAISTEGRVSPERPWSEPRGKITVQVKDASQPIGIFGHYHSLTLTFANSLDGVKHLWAQDLLATQSRDILSQVVIAGNKLTIPGKLIDRVGTSAGDQGDISVPGLLIQLEGKNLPDAGEGYFPTPKPILSQKISSHPSNQSVNGYRGTAKVLKNATGYQVSAKNNIVGVTLKKLPKSITDSKATFTWKMTPDPKNKNQNGFLILSAGDDALNAVFAGSFIKSKQITIFESSADWGRRAKKTTFTPSATLNCKAVLDMDARTLTLTINGTTTTQAFSEAVTSIDHIGFAVKGTHTHFTEPRVSTYSALDGEHQ